MTVAFLWGDKGPAVVRGIIEQNRGSTMAIILLLKPLILHFLPEVLDSILDTSYFFKLESAKLIVHPGNVTPIVMSVSLFLTLMKDFLCARWLVDCYYWYVSQGESEAETSESAREKVKKLCISAVLEDIPQVTMQYFFMEKVLLATSNFVWINGALMIVTSILFFLAILAPVEVC